MIRSERPAPWHRRGTAQGFGLRTHLLALALAVLLPALAVGAAAAWEAIGSYRANFQARLQDTARALALALDERIDTDVSGLSALSVAPALDPNAEPAARDALLRRAAASLGVDLALIDPATMRFLVHTAVPPGAPLPAMALGEAVGHVVETARPTLADLTLNAATGRLVIGPLVPVAREGQVVAVLAARRDPQTMLALLRAQSLPEGGFVGLIDAQGSVVARTLEHEASLGQMSQPWLLEATAGRGRGLIEGPSLEGPPALIAFERLRLAPGWRVTVAVPRAAFVRSWTRPLGTLALGAIPLLLLSALLALWLAQRLLRPVEALRRHASAVAQGQERGSTTIAIAPTADGRQESGGVAEFEALRSDIMAAETTLRESEARLRAIVETVPVGLVMAELPSGRILGGNAYVETMLRHPVLQSSDIYSYDEWISFHADGSRVAGHEYPLARMIMAGEENPSVEVHYQRGDGTRAWTRIMGRPIRNERSEIVGGVVALLDVDAERRTREALAEREARFRALFSSIDEGYCLCEMVLNTAGRPVDYRFLEVNPLFGEMSGLVDAVGQTIRELVPNIEPHWVETYARVAFGGEKLRFEQGSEAMGRWFDVFATPVEPRGRFAVVFKDVTERRRAETALRESEERFRFALEAAGGIGTWNWDMAGNRVIADAAFAALFGVDTGLVAEQAPLAIYLAGIHADDRPRVAAEIGAAVAAVGTGDYATEYRVIGLDGAVRWLVARGRCYHDPEGRPTRFPGVVMDITARKAAEERQALLAREVDHRAKNVLAVVQAALRLTPKDDAAAYARAVEGRVSALARAQTLLAGSHWESADLHALLEAELSPFLAGGSNSQRADLDGPKVALPPNATQPLAMALHELATNALKHGALSVPAGRVSVSWRIEREEGTAPVLCLRWAEVGGPALAGPPDRRGFGSRLIDGTIRGQLGGTVLFDWRASGLVCTMEVPLTRGASTPATETARID